MGASLCLLLLLSTPRPFQERRREAAWGAVIISVGFLVLLSTVMMIRGKLYGSVAGNVSLRINSDFATLWW